MNLKQSGFTLIELLGIILLLSIIALITIPSINNIIDQSDKNANQSSGNNYINSLENDIFINNETNKYPKSCYNKNEICIITEIDNNLVTNSKPSKLSLIISNGVAQPGSMMIINNYTYIVTDDFNLSKTEENFKYKHYNNGDEVYYNPEIEEKCDPSKAISTTETKTGCMKWYTILDEDTNIINLLLDHNTTARTTTKNMYNALKTDTNNWGKLAKSTAKLITADEVAKITNNENFNSENAVTNNWFFFDSKDNINPTTGTGTSQYKWLYNYAKDCILYGCDIENTSKYQEYGSTSNYLDYSYGYYTSTNVSNNPTNTWIVDHDGSLGISNNSLSKHGIRPIITALKANLE